MKVAVFGAGTMGSGIAQVFAAKGHTALLYASSPASAQKHKDKKHIYLADSTSSVFENGINYYLSPVLTRGISTDYAMYISSLSYHKNGQELFTCEIIPDEERVGTLKNQLHRIVSPENKKQDMLSLQARLFGKKK